MDVLKLLLPCCLAIALSVAARGQGCSDAGVCTAGSLQQNGTGAGDSTRAVGASLSFSYGSGEQGVSIFQAVPELEVPFARVYTLQARLPYVAVSGNLAKTSGAGDAMFSVTRRMWHGARGTLDVSAGMRIATGKTDITEAGRPLPMPYQAGLGTHDLVLGVSVQRAGWHAGIGYQHVLSGRNDNAFLHAAWPGDGDAAAYFESAGLVRQDDAVVRVEKAFRYGALRVTPGVLALYHTAEDRIVIDGTETPVPGSDGVTVNVTLALRYAPGPHASFFLRGGSPAVVRDTRPDGLTRSLVVTLGYSYRFNTASP